jgi:threonyl-tRNA synthetase
MSNSEQTDIQVMRHSTAHVFATAVMTLWPKARLGVGPAVEHGFYYDVDIPDVSLSDDDFKSIEKEMRKVIGRAEPFERSMKSIAEALQWAKDSGQIYKEELLNDLSREGTTVAK